MRSWLVVAILIFSGCASKKDTYTQKPKKEEPKKQQVALSNGYADQYSTDGTQQLWTIRWQSIDLELTQEAKSNGLMRSVTGTIYSQTKGASDFSGEFGQASQASKQLLLRGNVRIVSKTDKATLSADQVVYDGVNKRINAIGNVRVVSASGSMGTFSKVVASPDLKRIGTPDLYNQP